MSTQLSAKTTTRLIARLLETELTSSEVRAITKWTAPKMSIRLALDAIARANGLIASSKVITLETGRKMLCTKFRMPAAKKAMATAVAKTPIKTAKVAEQPAVIVVASKPKSRSAKKSSRRIAA